MPATVLLNASYSSTKSPLPLSAHSLVLLSAVDEGGLSGGEIAGIVIGVLVGLAIIGFIIHLSEQNKKKKAAEHQRHQAQLQAASAAARANAAREEAGRAEAARVARERAEEESAAQQVCVFMPAESQVAPQTSILYMYIYVFI